jgi:cell division protein FtsA
MGHNFIFSGLDIGSSTIKILICRKGNFSNFEILGLATVPSFGVRRGVVVDINQVAKLISACKEKVEEISQTKVEKAVVNVGGSHIFLTPSRGVVAVSRADQKISNEDVERVLQAAQTFSLPLNKEILDVFPKEFIVDEERGIKEVVGMSGVRLEVEILALGAFSPYLKNLIEAVLNSGIQIEDLVCSPLASARSVLSPQEMELGVALIDIGGGTTGLSVFEEGSLLHLAIFPVGSAHITNDIAIVLKSDIDTAERIKKEYGTLLYRGQDKKEKIEILGQDSPLVFSSRLLARVIEARVSEIFDLIQKELKKISRAGLLPAGVVICGGGAKLPKIVDFAKKELKLPARIGLPTQISGLEEDPSLALVSGLVLQAADLEEKELSLFGRGLSLKLKKIFKTFLP